MKNAEIRLKIEELLRQSGTGQLSAEVHKNLAQKLASWIGGPEWVTRAEHERLLQVLQQTEEKLQLLEQRLTELEQADT
ncbi:accessory factor UbiK family protein [Oceanobacter mangrovi]|uniref:accessory factor UbiK family protein n=1 Tax=Oceanobacter mangrovi TaxID=2862510 RepID=UPI001C8E8A31|nr:accessory factor UbiK family protein [Oceanobacter mangrovi]